MTDIKVEDTERVIVDEPGYLRNLTKLLPETSNRTIANYMFWRSVELKVIEEIIILTLAELLERHLDTSTRMPERFSLNTGVKRNLTFTLLFDALKNWCVS